MSLYDSACQHISNFNLNDLNLHTVILLFVTFESLIHLVEAFNATSGAYEFVIA